MARALTGPDFELMMAINEGDALDWIAILSSRFESIVKKSSRNSALGGGSMITLIAMRCNFTFGHDGCPEPSRMILDVPTLKHMRLLKKDGKTWEEDHKPHKETLSLAAEKRKRNFKARNHLYCLANLTPSPPSSPIPPSPAASEPEAPIAEELPTVEPAVESAPPTTDAWAEWRERVSSDIADLRSGLASLEAFTRAEALRARQESEWLRTTLLSMIRGPTAPVDPGPSVPRATSPLPPPPFTDTMEEDDGDSTRVTTSGDDEATSSASITF